MSATRQSLPGLESGPAFRGSPSLSSDRLTGFLFLAAGRAWR
jgi:hypothetical protein